MRLFLLVVTIHFLAGALSVYFINKRLTAKTRKENWLKYLTYLLIFVFVLTTALLQKTAFLGCSILIFSAGLFELLKLGRRPCKYSSRNQFIVLSLIIYSSLCMFFSLFVLLPAVIIAYTYVIVIIFDGASQLTGQAIGRSKILPLISPGKTWEGFTGGLLSAGITSVILHGFAGISVFWSLIFGVIICLASFTGDMAASAYKRAFNTKDFGSVLPGQGGILDRFDSFLASGAIVGFMGFLSLCSAGMIDRNIAVYLGYSLGFALILLTGESIHILFNLKAEYSRIFSHVLVGIASIFMTRLFTSGWYIIFFCIQSAIFLSVSKKMGLFGSHHKVARNTNGSSYFFIGLIAVLLISEIRDNASLFVLPVLVLSISDPVASVSGLNRKRGFWPEVFSHRRQVKTFIGSIGFFISAFIILMAGISFYYDLTIADKVIYSLTISLITTIAEALSPEGYDNISIPLIVAIGLQLLPGGAIRI
jgi:phosphatidate cytidylyltransferase